MVATLQAKFWPAQGIVDYSSGARRLAWRTARAFASAWRRRFNTSGSVTLRRVRMVAAAAVVDRGRRVVGEVSRARVRRR